MIHNSASTPDSVFAKLPSADKNAQDYNNFCRGVKLLFHDALQSLC